MNKNRVRRRRYPTTGAFRKTLPSPEPSLHAKPSALSPFLRGSRLAWESRDRPMFVGRGAFGLEAGFVVGVGC